jgi:Ca2+-binding EF-hand superfamily protein
VFRTLKITLCIAAAAAFVAVGSFVSSATAQEKQNVPKAQDKIALSAAEVKQLVIMMDTDKSGKVSKKEFMDFMSAEFDRLDMDKSGELDVKELAQSQFRPAPHQSLSGK